MPTRVILTAGTNLVVSHHEARLVNDVEVEFDLPNRQAVAESLMHDPVNMGLNLHLLSDEAPKLPEPLIIFDDQVVAPGFKVEQELAPKEPFVPALKVDLPQTPTAEIVPEKKKAPAKGAKKK